jgi:YVTN family beta-propeller protein
VSLRSCEKYLLLAAAAALVACSGSEPSGDVEYSGVAYPDHRPSFAPDEHRLGYVANRISDSVSVIDLDDMTLLGTVPVGRDPVDIDGPRHVVLDVDGGLAYIALSYPFSDKSPHALTEGELQRSGYVEALSLEDLSIVGDLRVDSNAEDVAFSPVSGMLAVTHYDVSRAIQAGFDDRRANLILVDDPRAIATADASPRRIPLCPVTAATAFNADGSRAFVACVGTDSIAVVDTESGEMLSSVAAGDATVNKPYALVVDTAHARLLSANQVSSTVSVFDLSDEPSLLSTLRTPGLPLFPAWISESTLAVPLQMPNGAVLFDTESGEQTLQIQYADTDCQNPSEFSVTNDGRVLLVCSGSYYGPGAVVEVDPSTLEVISSVNVGVYPERMSILQP